PPAAGLLGASAADEPEAFPVAIDPPPCRGAGDRAGGRAPPGAGCAGCGRIGFPFADVNDRRRRSVALRRREPFEVVYSARIRSIDVTGISWLASQSFN